MSKTVKVNFIDTATNEIIGTSKMPPENLPQTFEVSTTLHIKDEDWNVVRAEPTTAKEFVKSGLLNLTLRKIVRIPVEDILYSLPTLANDIGAIQDGSSKAGKNVLSFHEDNWRQFEFVSNRFQTEIQGEFTEIRKIWQEKSVKSGDSFFFREVHVREQIPAPIAAGIKLDQLFNAFPVKPSRYEGFSYDQSNGLVKDGFAFRVGDTLDFYGLAPGGNVTVLGLLPGNSTRKLAPQTVETLAKFMADNKLSLIYWPNLEQTGSDPAELSAYFENILYFVM